MSVLLIAVVSVWQFAVVSISLVFLALLELGFLVSIPLFLHVSTSLVPSVSFQLVSCAIVLVPPCVHFAVSIRAYLAGRPCAATPYGVLPCARLAGRPYVHSADFP